MCTPEYHLHPDYECFVTKELRNHRNWLQELATLLPPLKSFSINVYLDTRTNGVDCQCKLLKHMTSLKSLDDLTALRVYESDMERCWRNGCADIFQRTKKQLMEYQPTKDPLHQFGECQATSDCDDVSSVNYTDIVADLIQVELIWALARCTPSTRSHHQVTASGKASKMSSAQPKQGIDEDSSDESALLAMALRLEAEYDEDEDEDIKARSQAIVKRYRA